MSDFDALPELRTPMLVAAFEGWNDAGDAATTAVEHLELAWEAEPLAIVDPEDYYDFQVNRPIVSTVDGNTRSVQWPTTRLSACSPPGADRDVVLVRGIEPSMRWRSFCEEILSLCHDLGVEKVVLLGALLADTPHTRPVPVTGTCSDVALAARLGMEPSRYEGPTGIVGVLAEMAARAGFSTVSYWAQVPHYASQPPSPKATQALLRHLEDVLDVGVPMGEFAEQAEAWQSTVDQLAAEDEEMSDYIRQLEQRDPEPGLTEGQVSEASGEALAEEFERYLRRRGPGATGS